MNLTPELRSIRDKIKGHALDFGLDPFETMFEMVDFDEMNEIASYGGFPTRYPHWRFGMQFEELQKGYVYGLQKIYELVINNDPCYAYLMKANSLVDQKMVIAHVYGHSDFFKNNLWFSQTSRKMVDEMANHGTRLRRHVERHGETTVEQFLDACLSLENLIDPHSVYSPKRRSTHFEGLTPEVEHEATVRKLKSKDYMDRFVNPPDFVQREKKKIDAAAKKKKHFPEEPERDVLLFLIENAPHLEDWQRDILSIVREEAYYFAPQAMTKIMNEGWASYWHSTLMTTRVADTSEIVDYADHHSGTMGMRPGTLNPYKIGIELFRDIEDRWNKGKFGKDYDACENAQERKKWDRKLGLGRKKIYDVRRIYNDVTFIDEFLTKEFCEEQKLFVYKHNPQSNRLEISDREFEKIKHELLFRLTNAGYPIIKVLDGNYSNRGELVVHHFHEGSDLDLAEGKETLRNLHRIWQRPVHIETVVESEKRLYSYDGEKYKEQTLGD
ncbi:MAG: SpoVR family protein [Planctomycetes bacterium]|nr:SpoVR family protein [Planctomycetota bacterium]